MSPRSRIACGGGPIQINPASITAWANSAFSDHEETQENLKNYCLMLLIMLDVLLGVIGFVIGVGCGLILTSALIVFFLSQHSNTDFIFN